MTVPHRSPVKTDPFLRHRKSADKLRPDQLTALKDGFRAIKELRDNRGFWHFAGMHGAPGGLCQHSTQRVFDGLFLPWHRAYMYQLEIALQTQVAECTLPWWDWPTSRVTGGIPAAYADVGGEANPLAGAELPSLPTEPPEWPERTSRDPDPPEGLPDAVEVERIVALPDFNDFSQQLEVQLHNRVHGWVGGTMGRVATAAYDPIFWAHHTMVDRIWSLWQTKHSDHGPRPEVWRQALTGFDMTVQDVLETPALGYVYAGSTQYREVES
jgi:tyrosinase